MALYQRSDASMLRTAWELSAGMLSFVVAIAIGWWAGRTLDGWAGTSPWLTAVFTLFGLVAGVLNVKRALQRALAGPTRERRGPPSPPPTASDRPTRWPRDRTAGPGNRSGGEGDHG